MRKREDRRKAGAKTGRDTWKRIRKTWAVQHTWAVFK